MKKKTVFFAIKFTLTVGLLVFFLYRTNIKEIFASIQCLSLYMIPLALFLNFISIIIISYKWKTLLQNHSLLFLIKYNIIATFYSIVLPGQLSGDVVKSYMLSKIGSEPHKIFASVFVDKVTGLISLIVVAVWGMLFTVLVVPKVLSYSMFTLLALFVILLMSMRSVFVYDFIAKIIFYISNKAMFTKSVCNHILQFIDEWRIYLQKTNILAVNVLLGIVYHVLIAFVYFILSNNIGITVSFFDWCWIYGLLSVVLLLPISIAGIGLREGTLIPLLALFYISNEKAIALSFILAGFGALLAISGLLVLAFNRIYDING